MPILDLQRQMMEIGRLRLGQQVPAGKGTRPAKLETWRFTSANEAVIRQAAKLYGGEPQPWQAPAGPQFELISETTSLPVLVPPASIAFSQWYESWSGGGCQRRCDGITETISDGPCLCDPDQRECKIHSRLSVLLSDLAGLGVWRVETSGWYAARELSAAVDVIALAAGRGELLPATLRLEQRMTKRPNQGTRRFAVPVLDIAVSPAQLLGGSRAIEHSAQPAIEAPRNGLTPVPDTVPERPTTSIAEQVAAEKPRRKSTQQPIPKTGIKPRTAKQAAAAADISHETAVATVHAVMNAPLEEPPPDETQQIPLDEPEPIRPAQLKKLVILLREAGFGDDDRQARLDYCAAAIGRVISSSKELTVGEASKVIDTLEFEGGRAPLGGE